VGPDDPVHSWLMWTAEERYQRPDEALLRDAEAWTERFRPDRLRELVTTLPGPRSRLHAPEAMAATDALVSDAWRLAGWTVGRQRIAWRRVKGNLDYVPAGIRPGERRPRWHTYEDLAGTNLVAISEGETDEAIVLVAHHDTVRGSPGADDNGAALAMLLDLAAHLRGRRFRRTVILAAPDFEEIGLLGSRPLVRWLRATYQVRAAVVFDPIGFMDSRPRTSPIPPTIAKLYPGQAARIRARDERADTVVAIYRRRSAELVRRWSRCLAATIGAERVIQLRDPLDLPLVGPALSLHPMARNFSRSDHVRFWEAGLPAIQVTNTANFRNRHYHQPTDTPDTLDYETLARIAAATALLVEDLAG
jgi:hypothetical protein